MERISIRLVERTVYAGLILCALLIALSIGGCSARAKAFKKAGVERHQPKFQ